jgi:hypothetical protein
MWLTFGLSIQSLGVLTERGGNLETYETHTRCASKKELLMQKRYVEQRTLVVASASMPEVTELTE